MYAVVGCTDCSMLWLLSDPDSADSAQCPRCERTHQTAKLKRLFESDDRAAAREARAALLAKKRGDSAAFAEVDHVAELEAQIEDSGIDDREYLEAAGIDADRVAEAGDTTSETASSQDEIVREALREASDDDHPMESDIVAYAEARNVPPEKAKRLLDELCRRGEASESRGRYRLL